MPFEKGNKLATQNKGKKQKRKIIQEKLDGTMTMKDYNDIVDFKNDLIKLANELIAEASTFQERKSVFDSVSKYVFFEKHEDKPKENVIEVKFVNGD